MKSYLEEPCTLSLERLSERVVDDFGVTLSTSTIRVKLPNKLIAVKQACREPSMCNNEVNKVKCKLFAEMFIIHIADGDYVVYYDESNNNLFCIRLQGRAVKGEHCVVKRPPSHGKNLKVQCSVSTEDVLVLHQLRRGSICMEEDAEFAKRAYTTINCLESFQRHFEGRKIVIVLDNVPTHNPTESRLEEELGEHIELDLLRLVP
ncbi:hypothetical protein AM587_10008658 [Phytophthora nicotianae]|uniref:Tc1-like transposase DDE domain-containing protein n=1 Tax=Phytophthora nicotianae TaxID=4792 RepID=A0A0W8AXL2_PHYNI|nr:hypothetical protein AM587_10008658 [Phytophthora nicotianae]